MRKIILDFFWIPLSLFIVGAFAVASSISAVQASTCQNTGSNPYPGPNYANGSGTCDVPSGNAVSTLTVTGGSMSANNVSIAVPYGTGVSVTGGSLALTGQTQLYSLYGSGGGITGLLANGAGTQITADNIAINLGSGALAANAVGGGLIILGSGTTINIGNGGGNYSLQASGTNSKIVATGVTMTGQTGGGDAAVHATQGGEIDLDNSVVNFTPQGGGVVAMLAEQGSKITANSATVYISGSGGNLVGLEATGSSTLTLNGDTLTVMGGSGSKALWANASTLSVTNTGISLTSDNAEAALLQNGSTMSVSGGSIQAIGNGTYGFLINGTGSNTLQLSDTSINSSADVFHVQGANATITANNISATSGNEALLNVQGSSSVTFDASSSTLSGVITTNTGGGSTAAVTLSNGTLWTVTGSSNMTSLTNDDSVISLTPPTGDPSQLSSYKTLTTNNYAGSGGTIELNTYLGTDGSPSDRLIINGGSATGTTGLGIHNAAGPGDETTGNGILVVQSQANGVTSANAFTLSGEARGGAFDYYLFRGGIGGSDPEDWFLRSTFEVPGGNGGGESDLIGPDPVFPVDPPSATLSPGTYPIIGPELATYGVVQPIARQMGLMMLGTMHERIGDTLTDENIGTNSENRAYTWGRFFGQNIDNRYEAFTNPSANGRMLGIQSGFDLWRGSFIPDHRDIAGFYFGYSNSDMSVKGLTTDLALEDYVMGQTGNLVLNAYSVGSYWTHYGPGGWYLDAVVQGTLYRGSATTENAHLPISGAGVSPSLEAGYPIPLPLGPGFALEPQMQAIWQYVSFHQENDGLGPVALGSTVGTTGRVGIRGQWTMRSDDSVVWQPYGRVNLWKDWGGNATTTLSNDEVPLLEQTARLEFAGGLTTKLNDILSIYAQAGYQVSVDPTGNNQRQGFQGDVGLHYTW